MKKGLLFCVLMALSSCRTTYPDACELSTEGEVRAWRCKCKQVKVVIDGGPAPAGVLTWKCDGETLPLTITTDDVGVPKCR